MCLLSLNKAGFVFMSIALLSSTHCMPNSHTYTALTMKCACGQTGQIGGQCLLFEHLRLLRQSMVCPECSVFNSSLILERPDKGGAFRKMQPI